MGKLKPILELLLNGALSLEEFYEAYMEVRKNWIVDKDVDFTIKHLTSMVCHERCSESDAVRLIKEITDKYYA